MSVVHGAAGGVAGFDQRNETGSRRGGGLKKKGLSLLCTRVCLRTVDSATAAAERSHLSWQMRQCAQTGPETRAPSK